MSGSDATGGSIDAFSYLGHLGLLGGAVQQDADGVGVALAGGDVQGGVAGGGGGVWVGLVLQQQLHQFFVAHAGRTVQGGLVVLLTRTHTQTQRREGRGGCGCEFLY